MPSKNMEGWEGYMTRFDQSVFGDDVTDVMKLLEVWYTNERHELVGCKQPFGHWSPCGDPIFDMSWLAFGFNLEIEAYFANPWHRYTHRHGENRLLSAFDCRPVAFRAIRALARISEFSIPDDHPQRRGSRESLRWVVSGNLPAAPTIRLSAAGSSCGAMGMLCRTTT